MTLVLKVLSIAGLLILLSFGIDLALAPKKLDSVRMQPLLAVPKKNGRTEFILDEPYDAPCVHSLFPHFGAAPCWYAVRHNRPVRQM